MGDWADQKWTVAHCLMSEEPQAANRLLQFLHRILKEVDHGLIQEIVCFENDVHQQGKLLSEQGASERGG